MNCPKVNWTTLPAAVPFGVRFGWLFLPVWLLALECFAVSARQRLWLLLMLPVGLLPGLPPDI